MRYFISYQGKIPKDSALIHRRNSYTPLSSHDQVKRPRLYSAGNQPWLPLAPTPAALMPEGQQSQVSARVTGPPPRVSLSCNQSPPTTVSGMCLAFLHLRFWSSRSNWLVCVEVTYMTSVSLSVLPWGHVLDCEWVALLSWCSAFHTPVFVMHELSCTPVLPPACRCRTAWVCLVEESASWIRHTNITLIHL